MIWWIILVIYVPGYIYSTWRFAGMLAWAAKFHAKPEIADLVMGWVFGPFLALIWPIVLPINTMHVRGGDLVKFSYVPPNERKKMYKRRIEELEREVGIR